MSKSLHPVWILSLWFCSGMAMAQEVSPPTSALLKRSAEVIGTGVTVGGGGYAMSSLLIVPAPVDAEIRLAAAQALQLDEKLKARSEQRPFTDDSSK